MARYRTINVDLNRQYRNDLNANFAQIEQDIIGQENFTVEMKDSLLTELARIEQESIDRDNTLARQNLEVLLQSIEDAKANANTAASNANTKANYAQTQGDYAKSQGDYANSQGDYAQTKGEYADEKANLADQAAANANNEAGNLSQLKIDVVTATQDANTATDSANTATTNANDSATYATEQGDYAKTQGNYANEKGLLAHNEASNLSQLKADAQTATTNANTAATNANAEASNLSTLKSEVQTATTNANTATSNAQTQANHAKTQGDYAKNQGNFAKQQGDIIQDILDQGTVASVNSQTGAVVLDAEDVGAIPSIEKGIANGVAKLNASGKVVDASGNEVEGKVKSVNNVQPDTNGNITIDIPEPDLSGYATTVQLSSHTSNGSIHTTQAEKDKLAGIETGANKYTHPSTHPASMISIADATNLFTATNVEGALSELFTNVSNGKNQIATAITDKGVSASGSDTFSTLANKIGMITGAKYAQGIVNMSSGIIAITGLGFEPTGAIITHRTSANTYLILIDRNKRLTGILNLLIRDSGIQTGDLTSGTNMETIAYCVNNGFYKQISISSTIGQITYMSDGLSFNHKNVLKQLNIDVGTGFIFTAFGE